MSSPQPSESDHWDGPSDHEVDDSGDEDEASDSSSSGSPDAYLDVEASEADADEQQSADGSIGRDDDDDDGHGPLFPHFMELPAELREMVWKAFCPDLTGRPRVFEILVEGRGNGPAYLTHRTPGQTSLNRTVLGIHRESRELALKISPSQIIFKDEQHPIPCDYRKDVVLINFPPGESANDNALILIDDCLSQFHNVALTKDTVEEPNFFPSLLGLFDNLRNVFIVDDGMTSRSKGMAWCVSGMAHEYTFTIEEGFQDWSLPIRMTYIWPDITKHRDASHRQFPTLDSYAPDDFDDSDEEGVDPLDLNQQDDDDRDPAAFNYMPDAWVYEILRYRRMMAAHFNARIDDPRDEDAEKEEGAENAGLRLGVWPMALFEFESGQERLIDLKSRQGLWIEGSSASETPDIDSPPNEYESDGIDDDDLGDLSTDDDEEDGDLIDDEGGQGNSDDDTSDYDDMLVGTSDLGGLHAAQFSSDSEAGSLQSHDGNGSHVRISGAVPRVINLDFENERSDEEIQSGPSRLSRHRPHAIVDDSGDEKSEETEGPLEPARGVKRRARAMLLDSDDDEDQENESPGPSRAAKRRARPAVASDSEDEDEDEVGLAETTSGGSKVPKESPVKDEEQEEESSEEEEDDEPAPPKRISLAKRLQMEYTSHRAARPTDDSGQEDAERQSYDSASDDDEGGEDESDGGAMVMGTAEECNEEEEEEGDGW